MLVVILKINNMILTVANIYGPNNDDRLFFDDFHSLLFEHGEEPYVIARDFNTVLEPRNDKFPKTFQNHPSHYGNNRWFWPAWYMASYPPIIKEIYMDVKRYENQK